MRDVRTAHLKTVLALAVCFGSIACSSDSGTDPSDASLSQAEAISVSASLFAEVSTAIANATFNEPSAARPGMSALVMPSFSFNGNCAAGGTVSGSGTYTENSYDFTYSPNNCKVNAGKLFVVNGDPNIHMSWTIPSTGNMSYSVNGGIKWDGGSCKLNYTASASPTTGHGTLKGTMCGLNIDSSF